MSTKPGLYLYNTTTGERVNVGDVVTDFRGETAIVTGWYDKPFPSTGRVEVQRTDFSHAYYPSVFGLALAIESVSAQYGITPPEPWDSDDLANDPEASQAFIDAINAETPEPVQTIGQLFRAAHDDSPTGCSCHSTRCAYDPKRRVAWDEERCLDCGFISRTSSQAYQAHDNLCSEPAGDEHYDISVTVLGAGTIIG